MLAIRIGLFIFGGLALASANLHSVVAPLPSVLLAADGCRTDWECEQMYGADEAADPAVPMAAVE